MHFILPFPSFFFFSNEVRLHLWIIIQREISIRYLVTRAWNNFHNRCIFYDLPYNDDFHFYFRFQVAKVFFFLSFNVPLNARKIKIEAFKKNNSQGSERIDCSKTGDYLSFSFPLCISKESSSLYATRNVVETDIN